MANKKKKGFSLVEVAIALAIVVIVTVTALTIVLNSIAPKINNNNREHAQNFAHNVWQCFEVANRDGDVCSLLGSSYDLLDMTEKTSESGVKTYIYRSEEHKYTAEITLLFPTNGGRPKMNLVITREKGDEIIAFEYTRGAGA